MKKTTTKPAKKPSATSPLPRKKKAAQTKDEHLISTLRRPTVYASELRDVPLADVAMLASRIMQGNESLTPARATNEAYELLELAAAGQRRLAYDYSWQKGIEELEKLKAARKKHEETRIPDDLEKDEKGRPKFDDVLKLFMPDGRKVKAVERLPRFRRAVMDFYDCDNFKAGDIIAEWRVSGVPSNVYQLLCMNWNQWWEGTKSESNSKNRKKGAEAKKGKQGTVRRREKDKRLASNKRR